MQNCLLLIAVFLLLAFLFSGKGKDEKFSYWHAKTFCPGEGCFKCSGPQTAGEVCFKHGDCESGRCQAYIPTITKYIDGEYRSLGRCQSRGDFIYGQVPTGYIPDLATGAHSCL